MANSHTSCSFIKVSHGHTEGPLVVAMLVQDLMLVMVEGKSQSPTLAVQPFLALKAGAMLV